MSRRVLCYAAAAGVVAILALAVARVLDGGARAITVDYPLDGSVFPPEFPPPVFEWRDDSPAARVWTVEVRFGDGPGAPLRRVARGEPPSVGEIDPRAVAATNQPPALSPRQAQQHTWRPDPATWLAIKHGSTGGSARVEITGYADEQMRRAVSRGRVTLATSTDPVGAPIFYRDVPLMPSAGERGVIKPLDQRFVPLIAWRLRNVADTRSRVVMEGIHSCANCHSVSRDGRTMGMDLDGPQNDKGLYALFPIASRSEIRPEHVVAWSSFRGKLGGKLRVGFMSQVSPDGRHVVTGIADPGRGQTDYERRQAPADLRQSYYVANFTDYRFLQVFYPTRGILAWYGRETGRLTPLPGADDPRYVHTGAVWSPDGSYLVFARAEAKDAYPDGAKLAERANDPNETQIRYDLYRIPFDGGRGGRAVPIAGASGNGMSNSFPRVSPDGRFIVFVRARNGQLMRPDGELHIVPAQGGEARRMRANTPLMNSWHSFSPNGRWLVFSSKGRSPYTQMFLTHVDEQGNDTPAILVENATAANRAVNIPEFVAIPPDTPLTFDAPVAAYYRLIDVASEAMNRGEHAQAIPLLREALAANPGDAFVHNSFGSALAATGRLAEAVAEYRRAAALSPDYPEARNNLASALVQTGKLDAAIAEFRVALRLRHDFAEAHSGLGGALAQTGRTQEALPHLSQAVELAPGNAMARVNLCLALIMTGRAAEAVAHAEQAAALTQGRDPLVLDLLGRSYAGAGRLPEAILAARQALELARGAREPRLVRELEARLSSYEASAASAARDGRRAGR